MVSSQIVMDTVKRMVASGVDDETIRMTLQGINLTEQQISEVIASARGKKPLSSQSSSAQAPAKAQVNAQDENSESDDDAEDFPGEALGDADDETEPDTGEDIRKEVGAASQEQLASHTVTHQMLDEHSGKIDDVSQEISALRAEIKNQPHADWEGAARLTALDSRLSGVEKEIGEVKANTLGLQSLLQKILEANREIILEIQKKK